MKQFLISHESIVLKNQEKSQKLIVKFLVFKMMKNSTTCFTYSTEELTFW
jgi:hypothetical protein